jgi:hypothetical protein
MVDQQPGQPKKHYTLCDLLGDCVNFVFQN